MQEGDIKRGNFKLDIKSCTNDIRQAERFAEKVVGSWDPSQDVKERLMNEHNSAVGRLAVRKNMQIVCRCMGLSGACNSRCCYHTLQPLRTNVDWLYKLYKDKSVKVRSSERWKRDGSAAKLVALGDRVIEKEMLIYLNDSPDYCKRNVRFAAKGTSGRLCNINVASTSFSDLTLLTTATTKAPKDNCDKICCGRGYRTRRVRKTSQCKCRFKWCCDVQCQTCQDWVQEHRCK